MVIDPDGYYVEPGGVPQTVVQYDFTHDANGNPLSRTAGGDPAFATDDRTFTIDALNRLTDVDYDEYATPEESALDVLGNRETHTDRGGATTGYGEVNKANEYPSVAGQAVVYDDAGNLIEDEAGREYVYDERNRLVEVRDSGAATLAAYTYDALGRRVTATIDGVATRYYHDGRREIEQRDGSDVRTAYHVNGGQFIDERVATFDDAAGAFRYYLHGENFSVAGFGDADGGGIERLDYTAGGAFPAESCDPCDANCDGVVDSFDIEPFIAILSGGMPCSPCAADVDCSGTVDAFDIEPFIDCLTMGGGVLCTSGVQPPPTGTFLLHGRPADVLSDGKVLLYVRARFYDPEHGRWLQRDPSGYSDGGNLYESFRSNPERFTDPAGNETKLASRWHNGDEVLYQRILFGWTDEEFSVGRYYHVNGAKVLLASPSLEDYDYLVPLEIVEQWGAGLREDGEYGPLLHKLAQAGHAQAVDRITGQIVDVRLRGFEKIQGAVGGFLGELVEADMARFEGLLAQIDPSRPLWTVLAGEVTSPIFSGADVGRTATGGERIAAALELAAWAAPTLIEARSAIVARRAFRAQAATATIRPPSMAARSASLGQSASVVSRNAYNISTASMTAAEREATINYARRTNAWLAKNGPVTVQPTAGTLRSQASEAARLERLRAARAGQPYAGQAGHVPDTALTGSPVPPAGWLDMPGASNNVIGGGLSSRIGNTIEVITVDGKIP